MHYIFVIFRPLQINHVCDNFRAHGVSVMSFDHGVLHSLRLLGARHASDGVSRVG